MDNTFDMINNRKLTSIQNTLLNVATVENQRELLTLINSIANNSASGGGGIKSIQRGVTSAAGQVTISAVDVNKSFLYSVSKASAGTVAARGTVSMAAANVSVSQSMGATTYADASSGYFTSYHSSIFSGTVAAHTGTLSGGTTDLTVKVYSAVLTNSTTITCDGAVEWQLIEYL